MRLGIGLGLFKAGLISAGVRIFSAFQTRVIGDGGTVEAGTCVVNGINGSALLQQASLLLIPSGYKGGKLYAEIPTNGNGDLTWTRASDAFRTNASGLIQRVPWNLLTYSEDFTNAVWQKNQLSVTANSLNAPNGTLTADTLVENTANAIHRIQINSINVVSSTSYTLSAYVKNNGRRYFMVNANTAFGARSTFDLQNGVVSATSSGTATITNVGDGWYRVSVTGTASSTMATTAFYQLNDSGVAIDTTYTGDGMSGFFIWGAQLVEGTTAQTYLPTTDRLNFPRLSYMYGSCPSVLLEPQRTNSIRNSTMVGASTSPSTLPTNYLVAGITGTVVGIGTENGLSYVDIRFSGTASGTNTQVQLETTTAITASNGQTWTQSVYLKLINTSTPPTDCNMRLREGTATGVFVADGITAISPTTSLQRFTYTRTNTGALTERIQPILLFNQVAGNTYDYTIRIAQPQMELGAYATTPILTTGSATATRVADSFSRNNIYTNGLISASGGTWFVEFRNNLAYTRDNGQIHIALGDTSGGADNSLAIRNLGGGSVRLSIQKYIATANTTLFTTTTDTVKIAIKWNGSTADVFVNGTKQVSATSFTATQLQFLTTFIQVPLFIQQMALFPTPLSDTDCTTLTT